MKTYLLIGVMTLIVFVVLVREVIIISKRPQRKRELKHHVDMITDPIGCDQAISHYEACQHIIEHYGINLQDIGYFGYGGSDLTDLYIDVGKSLELAKRRREAIQLQFDMPIDLAMADN